MDDRREIEERVRGERNLRKMRVERKVLKKDVIWNSNRLGIDLKKSSIHSCFVRFSSLTKSILVLRHF